MLNIFHSPEFKIKSQELHLKFNKDLNAIVRPNHDYIVTKRKINMFHMAVLNSNFNECFIYFPKFKNTLVKRIKING